jgi:hypothetical protein
MCFTYFTYHFPFISSYSLFSVSPLVRSLTFLPPSLFLSQLLSIFLSSISDSNSQPFTLHAPKCVLLKHFHQSPTAYAVTWPALPRIGLLALDSTAHPISATLFLQKTVTIEFIRWAADTSGAEAMRRTALPRIGLLALDSTAYPIYMTLLLQKTVNIEFIRWAADTNGAEAMRRTALPRIGLLALDSTAHPISATLFLQKTVNIEFIRWEAETSGTEAMRHITRADSTNANVWYLQRKRFLEEQFMRWRMTATNDNAHQFCSYSRFPALTHRITGSSKREDKAISPILITYHS